MTAVTARVKLQQKIPNRDGVQTYLAFAADYKDGRNKEWAEWTPSLSLTMNVKNELAESFELEGLYEITIQKQKPTSVDV